jgi:PAS domain S-box-containing protein
MSATDIVLEGNNLASRLNEAERSIAFLRASIESTADGVVVVGRDNIVQVYNQRFRQLWNISESILLTADADKILACMYEILEFPELLATKVHEARIFPELEFTGFSELKDGRIYELDLKPQRLGCSIIGRVWTFRDVTERKRVERQLRESEERFRILAEASFEGLAIHDGKKFLHVNENAAIMFGYKPDEMHGMSIFETMTAETKAIVLESIAEDKEQTHRAQGRRRDGSFFWSEMRARKAIYQNRSVRLTSIRDITDRILMDEQREKLLEQEREARANAERSNKLREEFIAIASHELKTPLTPMKIYLRMLQKSLDEILSPESPSSSQLLTSVSKLEREVDRLTRLIDDLLDVSRITAGRMNLSPKAFDLSVLVKETLGRFFREIGKARCHLTIQAPAGATGVWDQVRIEQVVANLLTNALKYGFGHPIDVNVTTTEDHAVLSIRDHGIGIEKDDQARIFERFERAASIDHFGGLGLGLFISREIVVAHGGTISVDSEIGKGACFRVSLPRLTR